MSAMKWFRKHNKKLLVGLGGLLMVCFSIPQLGSGGGASRKDLTIGSYVDLFGDKNELTTEMVSQAGRELLVLQELNYYVLFLCSQQVLGVDNASLFAISSHVFYPHQQKADSIVADLKRLTTDLDLEDTSLVDGYIESYSNTDSSSAVRHYLLLSQEANQAGFIASQSQVTELLKLREQFISQQQGLPAVSAIKRRHRLTDKQLVQVVGNYISVMQYAMSVTNDLSISEQQLKHAVNNVTSFDKILGEYAEFPVNQFVSKVTEPTEADLQAQFESYKAVAPSPGDDENPFGFGYLLPDRVQIEVLGVDVSKFNTREKEAFKQLSVVEQEEQLQAFWSDNRANYTKVPVADPENPNAPRTPIEKSFDEAINEVRTGLIEQKAYNAASDFLANVKAEFDKMPASDLGVFSKLNKSFNTEQTPLVYKKTDYLSRQTISRNVTHINQVSYDGKPVVEALFSAKLLQEDGAVAASNALQLNDVIGPLEAQSFGNSAPYGIYMYRLIGVDKSRLATGLYDDGSKGQSALDSETPEASSLYTRVTSDWKNVQAMELAKQAADNFAKDAKENWEQAWAAVNDSLKPDDKKGDASAPNPLRTATLTSIRQKIDSLRQQAGSNRQFASYFQSMIQQDQNFLTKVVKAAQSYLNDSADALLTIDNTTNMQSRSFLVFKSIDLPETSLNDYLQRKARVSKELIISQQSVAILGLLSPAGIDQRHQYAALQVEETAEAGQ